MRGSGLPAKPRKAPPKKKKDHASILNTSRTPRKWWVQKFYSIIASSTFVYAPSATSFIYFFFLCFFFALSLRFFADRVHFAPVALPSTILSLSLTSICDTRTWVFNIFAACSVPAIPPGSYTTTTCVLLCVCVSPCVWTCEILQAYLAGVLHGRLSEISYCTWLVWELQHLLDFSKVTMLHFQYLNSPIIEHPIICDNNCDDLWL